MKSFDTNVVVRLAVVDDPVQCERAACAFRHAIANGGVFFSATVLTEVEWSWLRNSWAWCTRPPLTPRAPSATS